MAQVEGVVSSTGDDDVDEFGAWLESKQLAKFRIPLKQYVGIDSLHACELLVKSEIPQICELIPQQILANFGITLKDKLELKVQLSQLIQGRRDVAVPNQTPNESQIKPRKVVSYNSFRAKEQKCQIY